MTKILLASASVLALLVGGAFAQVQPSPGASSQGNVGPESSRKMKTTTGSSTMRDQRGNSKGMMPPAGPTNTNNAASQAGGGAGAGGSGGR